MLHTIVKPFRIYSSIEINGSLRYTIESSVPQMFEGKAILTILPQLPLSNFSVQSVIQWYSYVLKPSVRLDARWSVFCQAKHMLMAPLTVEFKELDMELDLWYFARMRVSFTVIRMNDLEFFTTRQLSVRILVPCDTISFRHVRIETNPWYFF